MSRAPTPEQVPILRAALGDAASARAAWRGWVDAGGDIEAVDDPSSRLLGLVYRNLRSANGANGADPRLAGIYRHNWSSNQIKLHGALPLLRRLAADGEPGLFIKGAAVLHLVPGGHGIRPMEDVDVLVRPGQVRTAVDVLREAGFHGPDERRLAQVRRHAHGAGFGRGMGGVDVHWRPLHLPTDDSALFAEASPMRLGDATVLVPRIEDAVVHVCAHAMGAEEAQNPSIRWLADIVLLLRAADSFDWDVVLDRARAGRIGPGVAAALRLARDHVDAPVPPRVIRELDDAPLGARLLHRMAVSDRLGVVPAYAQLWAINWRAARHRGERPTLRGFLGCVATRCKVPGPGDLPRHFAGRAWQKLSGECRCRHAA